jgi:DNA polymerase-4
MARPTAQTARILDTARGLLHTAQPLIKRQGITLIGVTVSNLDDDATLQLELPFERQPRAQLDAALDDLRERFGTSAVTRAMLLGRETGMTVPLLPD